MNIQEIIESSLDENKFIYCVFTTPRNKSENPYKKIIARPISIKNENIIQFEKFTEKQAFHDNLAYEQAAGEMVNLIINEYRNINLFTEDADFQLMVSKKGRVKVIEKEATKTLEIDSHNKKKKYIINENEPCDFLINLGVMTNDGKVYAKKYDKFRQINKFLEIVDDSLKGKNIKDDFMIIDFGCGKAYLTFALYYYFYFIRKINVKIIGLDLKDEVIEFCNRTAKKLEYGNLEFIYGDIQNFQYKSDVDMIVTLHACDTATDAALAKAVNWNTDIILSVPCCQHEFYDKIENKHLEPMLKHGLIKERVSSLVTDSLRSLFLETKGYKVQLMEFIAMEHTPKNILIRAVKTGKGNPKAVKEYENFKNVWNLNNLFIEEYYEKIQNDNSTNV
ncbi:MULTISPECIES: class I SAM-dependent methyltransferase [unclassified Sedimentibacter]|uniref:class I SAM-dependent methyltransferase n=1 Tax=unclassified Sedimentibacter TaxID=2649220 RepID=UPI0027E0701B|nr:SAM-dependent methyltransferase [Sedimentibacter sp. MB35-C1]WMJ78673.1 SAM-dependent methyltransferase [Sedimentibacter sp. MB35-C1]